jgi:hypothetical protein
VSAVRRIAVFVFVALWLPAMLHCRLEAAGLLFESDCCGAEARPTAPAADHGCADDSCELVEGLFAKPSAVVLKVPAPGAVSISPVAVVPPAALAPLPRGAVALATAAPPELNRPVVLLAPGPRSPRAP